MTCSPSRQDSQLIPRRHGAGVGLEERDVSCILTVLGARARGAHTRWLGPPRARALFPPPLVLCTGLRASLGASGGESICLPPEQA